MKEINYRFGRNQFKADLDDKMYAALDGSVINHFWTLIAIVNRGSMNYHDNPMLQIFLSNSRAIKQKRNQKNEN